MKRGKYSKRDGIPVTAWIPTEMVNAVDLAVNLEDSDRSKFIRNAIKERVRSLGIEVEERQGLEAVAN